MSFLLSDYFFPDITEKDYESITEQLLMMYKNNNCDENLLFYYFQIDNDILFKIFKIYKEKSDSDIEEFIRKFFKGDILNFFEKRILFVKSNSEKNKSFNPNDSWESTKILILNKYSDNIKNINLNILDSKIQILYYNVIEFNQNKIYMSEIIKNTKITHSIPFLYIFRIDKIFFHSYIDTYYENQNTSYSKWADYLEQDFQYLDSFINNLFLQKNNTFNFKFEKTFIIAFIIKFLFEYSLHITINLNKYLSNYNIFHRKIIDFISKKWSDEEFRIFRYIFTTDKKKTNR